MIVPGMFVCSSFLISVCMFIVVKALLISSATVITRAGGAIWLNPFATVLFSVCSAVTVECCVLYPCCMGVFGMFAVMYQFFFFFYIICIILNCWNLLRIIHIFSLMDLKMAIKPLRLLSVNLLILKRFT